MQSKVTILLLIMNLNKHTHLYILWFPSTKIWFFKHRFVYIMQIMCSLCIHKIYNFWWSFDKAWSNEYMKKNADKLCSGIVNGRVLNFKLYTHRRQKLTLLDLFTDTGPLPGGGGGGVRGVIWPAPTHPPPKNYQIQRDRKIIHA